MKQRWECEKCGKSNFVEFEPTELITETQARLINDHRNISPECQNTELKAPVFFNVENIAPHLQEDENGEPVDEGMFFAESLFGFNTRKGLVKLSYGITFEKMMSPSEARHFAHSILEAAEAAETDEFLMTWIEKRVWVKDDEAKVQVLVDFRESREKMRRDEEIESRN